MSPLSRRLVWVLALAGLAVSLTSLYVHYQMLVQPGYTSFCDINQTVNCQQAYLSRYGSVRGVPVALFGAIWFAFVLVLAFVGATGPASVRESVNSVPSGYGAGASLVITMFVPLAMPVKSTTTS